MIYAGGDRDPSQIPDPFVRGAIRIKVGPVDPSEGSPKYVGEFAAPGSSVWLKLVGVSGNTVRLVGEDGSVVAFDLNTHVFSK